MVMPKGYKKTEIGIIPENWEIGTVESFGSIVSGGTPSTTNDLYWNGNIRWCTPTDIKATTTPKISHTQKHITEKGLEDSSAVLLPINSVMICTRATIGEIRFNSLPMATNQGFKNIIVKNGDYLYLYYILTTKKHEMIALSYGTTFLELSKKALCAIPLQIPKISEQHAISNALYTIDILIDNLEKLIEKKKNIKQGAMQELLTGKRRLPGFDEEWITINFIKKSKVKARIGWQGLKKSEYLDSGYAYLVTGTDFYNGAISWNTCHFVEKERYDIDRNIQIKNNDLLITKDGSLGKTALVTGLEYPATLNSGIFVVRPLNKSYVPAFVYYILSSFVFREYLERLSAGSTIVHLYQKDLDKFEFMIPPTEKEQVAIAEVLSDMDKEIEELEKKLTKYRNLKKGMMSELLTGHIRLTEKEDA